VGRLLSLVGLGLLCTYLVVAPFVSAPGYVSSDHFGAVSSPAERHTAFLAMVNGLFEFLKVGTKPLWGRFQPCSQTACDCVPQATFDVSTETLQSCVDVEGAASGLPSELQRLLELALLAAVHCDDRATHVANIMNLPTEHQGALMVIINRMTAVMDGNEAAEVIESPLSRTSDGHDATPALRAVGFCFISLV
jgi:hypothetical protein